MTERVLTERELNRALLARQLLLERGRMPITRALERIGGIQAQYAPAMYIGLWSRIARFERDQLTQALERRSVVQATMMRSTIHLVSRADYWPLTAAVREGRRAHWLRVTKGADARELQATATKLRDFLADGPRRWKEIEERFGRGRVRGVFAYLDLARIPPSGTWEQRRADLFGLAEHWVGADNTDPDTGLELLVRRYLGGFGPAYRGDVAEFAGVPVTRVSAVLERMQLRRFRDESGKQLLDLPRAPLPDPKTPAPPRFLPTWDATLLVHARRTQILPEQYRPLVFNVKAPHSVSTFLIDGQVAGTWRYEDGKVTLAPFDAVPRKARRALDDEAARLAALHR